MRDHFAPGIGAVLSADIAVPEHAREVRFYSRVLSTGENPLWREEDLMNNLGMPIIGLGVLTAEYAQLPLQWMPHIQVVNVAVSVQRALDGGGSVLMHDRDKQGMGQWAVLQDPDGAAFGIIPTVPPNAIAGADGKAGPDAAQAVGRIAWMDLTVSSADAARDFYRAVVGWSVQDVPMKDGSERYADYNMLGEADHPVAGVCHARGVNAGLPSVWMIYLTVGDLAESLRRVEVEGGRVLRAQQENGGRYVYAAIQDPVGVHLALVPG
jgi:uncharacterized protein